MHICAECQYSKSSELDHKPMFCCQTDLKQRKAFGLGTTKIQEGVWSPVSLSL